MINSKLAKNASWIIGCKIAQSLVSFIIGFITARYLGPSQYGLISYAASVVMFVVPLVQLGLRSTIIEELIMNPNCEGEVLGTTLVMTVVSSICGMIGVFSFALIAHTSEKDTVIICTLHSISLVFQMTEMIQYWFQAKLMSKYTSIVSLIAYTVVSIYRVFLLVLNKSIYWFSVVTALDSLLVSAALLILYGKIGGPKLSFSISRGKKLLGKSRFYVLSGMMVTIYSQTDRIMIKNMIGDEANGFYSVAITCAGMASFVFQALIDSFRPVILEAKKSSPILFRNYMVRLYSIIIYLGLLQSIFLSVFAPLIIPIIYGNAYFASIVLLQIITWYSSFSYMGSVRNIWILAESKQNYLWIINLCGVLLNIVLNAVLIPFIGVCGAAIASVITQFFTNFVLCFIISPIKPTIKIIISSLNPKVILDMVSPKKFNSKWNE